MRPVDEIDEVLQDEPSLVGADWLVAYEQARTATGFDSRPPSDGEQTTASSDPLAGDLACIDLLHRVWPDFDDRPSQPGELPQTRILGDFRLIREIGRGGMGVVYEAEQISLSRRVAVKVLPFAGILDEKQLQRFKNEARAAATLEHPHIVPVYSVGCERGVHYFAMRFIEGSSLAELLKQKSVVGGQLSMAIAVDHVATDKGQPTTDTQPIASLSTLSNTDSQERFQTVARLGIQAAEALAYAHEQGILHRDIKPANLLVDVNGELWVADFGLARLEHDASLTATGDMLGTLRYMCPEQALGSRQVIDERADIYSLGATLYELLTLRPAFDGRDRQEILRQITGEEPKPPRKLDPRIPGDLETIVLKAMNKEAAGRYATARQLADDLQRFLSDQPIRARRPSTLETLRKWTRRHPAVTWASVAVLLVATIASATSAMLIGNAYRREAASAEQARESAAAEKAQRRRAEAVSEFLVDAVGAPKPGREGVAVTMVEVLDRAATELQQKFTDDPDTKSALLDAIGDSYMSLAEYAKSLPLFEQAHALRQASSSVSMADKIDTTESLAVIYAAVGRRKEAVELFEQLVELMEADPDHGPRHPATLSIKEHLAMLARATKPAHEALAMLEEVLALKKEVLGADHLDTLQTSHNVAEVYRRMGRTEEALQLMEQTLDERKASVGGDAFTIAAMQELADFYMELRRYPEAIAVLKETLEFQDRFGPNHEWMLDSTTALLTAYVESGQTAEAIKLGEESVPRCKAALGPTRYNTRQSTTMLARAYHEAGQLDRALPLYFEALEAAVSLPKSEDIGPMMHNLEQGYRDAGRSVEAVPILENALASAELKFGENHGISLLGMDVLARAYLAANRPADAESLARRGWGLCEQVFPDLWLTFNTRSLLGGALLAQEKYTEAEPHLLAGGEGLFDRFDSIPSGDKEVASEAISRLLDLYKATNRPEKVASWKKKLNQLDLSTGKKTLDTK